MNLPLRRFPIAGLLLNVFSLETLEAPREIETTTEHDFFYSFAYLPQFVLGFLGPNTMDCKKPLFITDQAEVLASLVNSDDIHEPRGIRRVCPDLPINTNETLRRDRL